MAITCPRCGTSARDDAAFCSMCKELFRKKPAAAAPAPIRAAPAPMPMRAELAPGDVLDQRYRIERVLGVGGFGTVFLVTSLENGAPYALKTLRPDVAAIAEERARFLEEAATWVRLGRHPYLVHAFVAEEHAGRVYLAMEYVPSGIEGLGSLDRILARRPPPLAQALRWGIQCCHAMEHARACGIVAHRDLKPANVLVDASGNVRVSDFGLASLARARTGTVAGTPTHMAPEQFVDAGLADERSDVYAMGVILHELATGGRLPFAPPPPTDGSPAEAQRYFRAFAQMHRQIPPRTIDGPLGSVVQRCLAKRPEERFASFAALRAALEPLLLALAGEAVVVPVSSALEAWEWNDRGITLGTLGRDEEALAAFDQALALEPGDTTTLTNKAGALYRLVRFDEALSLLDRAVAAQPSDDAAWANRGLALAALGRLDEARSSLEHGIALDPHPARRWANLGAVHQSARRHAEAADCYARAVALDPHDAHAWAEAASCSSMLGDDARARSLAERALSVDPTSIRAWVVLGDVHLAEGRTRDALAAYERALTLEPTSAEALANLAAATKEAGDAHTALTLADRAIALAPQSVTAWNNRAMALGELGRLDEALVAADRAITICPTEGMPHYNRGYALRALARKDEAIVAFARACELLPTLSSSWYFLADLRKGAAQHTEAIGAYERMLAIETKNQRAIGLSHAGIAECLRAMGDFDPAAAAADRARRAGIDLAPEASLVAAAGLAHAKARRFPQAIAALDRALALDPKLAVAWYDKSVVLANLGRFDDAIAHAGRAAAIDPKYAKAAAELTADIRKHQRR